MDIPKHWHKLPLKELIIVKKGIKPRKLSAKEFSNSIPYLDVIAMEKGKITQFADVNSSVHSTENDILVLRTGGRNGLILKGKIGAVGSTFICLSPIIIISNYLYYFLKSREFTFSGVRDLQNSFWDDLVPIPPIEEQKRIIEALEIRLKEYQKDFENAKKEILKIKEYKLSLLEEAVSGNLTSKWREENQMSHINWDKIELLDLVYDFQYGSSKRAHLFGKVPILRMGNIQNGKIDWNDLKYTSDDTEIQKFNLNKGDVLFNRTNSPELVGKTAVYEGERKAVFAGYIIRIICNEQLNPYYLNIYLNSNSAKQYIDKVKVGSANQSNISASKISKIIIPLPSIKEQTEIIQLVEKQLEYATAIEKEQEDTIYKIDKLMKSLLQMAFEGLLSKKEKKDETKTFLLDDIKIERKKLVIEMKETQKVKLKKLKKMKGEENYLKTILEILNDNEKNSMTVEELWEESSYSKSLDVELFYEELTGLSPELIEIYWQDDRKITSVIKLKGNAH